MPRWHTLEVQLTDYEFTQLSALAEQHRIPLSRLLIDAALNLESEGEVVYSGHQLQHIYREAKSRKHFWTEQELRERGLPLYWSESWVRKQLSKGLSLSRIALMCGANVRSVRMHVRQYHHIQIYHKLTPKQVELVHERLRQGENRRDIAIDLGVSPATIGKYAKGFPSQAEVAFRRRAEIVGQWPATTKQIAEKLFEGEYGPAAGWTSAMIKSGRLVKVAPGRFDLAKKIEPESASGPGLSQE